MSGQRVAVGPYRTPPPEATAGELAELRAEVRELRAEVRELRAQPADLGELARRLEALERSAQVAAGDRDDRAGVLRDLVRRLEALEPPRVA